MRHVFPLIGRLLIYDAAMSSNVMSGLVEHILLPTPCG